MANVYKKNVTYAVSYIWCPTCGYRAPWRYDKICDFCLGGMTESHVGVKGKDVEKLIAKTQAEIQAEFQRAQPSGLAKRAERERKWAEEDRRHKEWLKTPEGQQWLKNPRSISSSSSSSSSYGGHGPGFGLGGGSGCR